MIKLDFNTYVKKYIDEDNYKLLINRKDEIIDKFNNCNMIGWTERIDDELINDIKDTANYVKNNFDLMIVIGIGGSFLGSYAFNKMFSRYFNDNNFEVIYAGTSLSSEYLDELVEYVKDKNFCINVISKSGTTRETTITYEILKDVLKRKYSNINDHIIATTDKEKGLLREEVNREGYKSFIIPDDIGGRYSFLTSAHLLPLALNYDIDSIISGYFHGKRLIDDAYNYAVTRKVLFDNKKVVENYCIYEPKMDYFCEWLKQLFGESEGKDGVGILPMSTVHTRDLHSLGQFIQDGNKILFETFIKIDKSDNFIKYQDRDLHEINNIVLDSVINAHYKGGVPCLEVELDELSIENVCQLIYFFQLSAAFSSLLFNVDPFNQPGVEVYKNEVRERLG